MTKRSGVKWASLFMAVAMLCLSIPLGATAASFGDVSGSAWYAAAVSDLVNKGIINGTGPNTFSPNSRLTRGAFVTMLAKTALGADDLRQYEFEGSFKDVSESHWANKYINWAVETRIANGYEDDTFRPDKAVSRQEMAVFTVNFARATGRKLPTVTNAVTFADNDEISNYAKNSVRICQQAGVINGYAADNTFRPKGAALRCEAASLYSRFLSRCTMGNYTITQKRVYNTPVRAVEFDPDDYVSDLILGGDRVTGAEYPSNIVQRSGAAIAVNAAFFDLDTYAPLGSLIKNGRVVTVDNTYAPAKSAFVKDSFGGYSIEGFSVLHTVALESADVTVDPIKNVGVNKWPSSHSDATRILYTRDWGTTLKYPARDAVTIDENGVITAIAHYEDVSIPEKGYVLAQRARRTYEGNFFDSCKVGDVISISRWYDEAPTQHIEMSIGAGPRIVKDGAAYGDRYTFAAEGFTAADITTYNAMRMCIGIKKDGNLLILYSYTNLAQLGKIMVSFGCTDAINFDGGGSANLYVDGYWLVGPQSRALNNMLIFK